MKGHCGVKNMESSAQPEPTLRDVISQLDDLSSDVERLTNDLEASNTQFEKWDRRLWGLTLGLIGTA